MKILLVIPAIGAVYGGPSIIAVELARALGRQGVQIDIVTTNANGATDLDVPLGRWVEAGSHRVQYFPHWHWGDYKISAALTQWLWQQVPDYDLVHTIAVFSIPVLMAHWICRWHRIPYVISPQGMLEPWALSYKAWKKRLYYGLLEQPALCHASAVQVLTPAELANIRSLNLPSPAVIVPNGISPPTQLLPDPQLFYAAFPETQGRSLILFLGRIDPKKGLDLLARAFGRVQIHYPQAHLIIAGPDNIGFRPTAEQWFVAANCRDRVTFTGMLTGELKQAALAASQIYVAPSYSEGLSLSVLEGMAAGLPCVITAGCNFPEAIAARAAQVVAIDAEAIATALMNCLANPQAAREMGDRARQFVLAHYTWERIATQLIDLYTAILSGSPIPHSPPPVYESRYPSI